MTSKGPVTAQSELPVRRTTVRHPRWRIRTFRARAIWARASDEPQDLVMKREEMVWERMASVIERERELHEQILQQTRQLHELHLDQTRQLHGIIINLVEKISATQAASEASDWAPDTEAGKEVHTQVDPAVPRPRASDALASPSGAASKQSVEQAVAGVMKAVAAGQDPFADIDLTMPKRSVGSSQEIASSTPSTATFTNSEPSATTQSPGSGSSPVAQGNPDGVPAQMATDNVAATTTPASSSQDEQESQTVAAEALEQQKAAPTDAPPLLSEGDDDIFWVSTLHKALARGSFYVDDDDEQDFFFGPSTTSALCTFQACASVPETGITDPPTWAALLKDTTVAELHGLPESAVAAGAAAEQIAAAPAPEQPRDDESVVELGAGGVVLPGSRSGGNNGAAQPSAEKVGGAGNGQESGQLGSEAAAGAPWGSTGGEIEVYESWPVLREGDGGRVVHSLHVCMIQAGFHPGEDDAQWWMFGMTTLSALQTYQACQGLPESGVCDERTWLAFMGGNASPQDIVTVRSGDDYDNDLEHREGYVYLLGEQRWVRA